MARHILFDGTTTGNFTHLDGTPCSWPINGDGSMTVGHGNIKSVFTYGDAHIHVEWMEPDMPNSFGQGKGNSGVYIHGCYELQVLDSFGKENPANDDCGGIYQNYAPLCNVCKPALEWQTYDIMIRAARFNEKGEMTEAARLTVLQNGIMIQNNIILHRATPGGVTDHTVAEGPLMLQDHGNPVKFRNIWIDTQ